jgi:hypothetical protein
VTSHRHHHDHAERTMCDRSRACLKAGSWRDGEPLVGLVSCPQSARPWAWPRQVRGRAQATQGREQQARREDKTAHLCEPLADAVRGLVRETREACAAALRAPGVGQPRVAGGARAGNGHGLVSGPHLDTHCDFCRSSTGHGKMARRPRVVASLGTVASREVGHSRARAGPCDGVEPCRKLSHFPRTTGGPGAISASHPRVLYGEPRELHLGSCLDLACGFEWHVV